jgi:hypothetical protein
VGNDLDARGGRDCICEGHLLSSFSLDCVAYMTIPAADSEGRCGSISWELTFDDVLGSVSAGGAYVNTAGEEDYEDSTCYTRYKIPEADLQTHDHCFASYQGSTCDCDVNEDSCARIDCTEYGFSAVIEHCQEFFSSPKPSLRKVAINEILAISSSSSFNFDLRRRDRRESSRINNESQLDTTDYSFQADTNC